MSDDTNTQAALHIYVVGELHAEVTFGQDSQIQLNACKKLSARRDKDVA